MLSQDFHFAFPLDPFYTQPSPLVFARFLPASQNTVADFAVPRRVFRAAWTVLL
jgi:hypothetical protein